MIGLLVLAALAAGCSGEPSPPPAPPEQPSRLIRRLEGDIGTLNFLLHTTDAERQVLDYLHDPLVELDENLRPVAGTAARWEVSQDGRSFTFHLDPKATFSDGRPVTADDVMFTVTRIVDESSPQYASMFDSLDRPASRVINPQTVQFVFKEPRAAQLSAFNIAVLPRHVYETGNFKNDFNDTVLGNGPYRLTRFVRGRDILLERRPDYWRQQPEIESILFKVIADDGTAWMAMKGGQLHEMRLKPDVWAAEKDLPQVRDRVAFHDVWLLSYNCIAWNLKDPLLRDVRVRRALAMAYDRPGIISGLYRGQARPVTGPFTPDQDGYNSAVQAIAYDPKGAAELLRQAGWRDTNGDQFVDRNGRKFELAILLPSGHVTTLQQAQAYQQTLKEIGVDLQIRPVDGSAMFQSLMTGDYQAAFMAWSSDPEPDLFPLFHSTQRPPNGMNIVGYSNPEVDKLIDRIRREMDSSRRNALQQQLHEVIARDQPYLFTVQVATKWGVDRRIRNVKAAEGLGLFFWYPGPVAWSFER